MIQAVVRTFVLDDGKELYQPCLIRYSENTAPHAGELLTEDAALFDSMDVATKRAAAMAEEFLAVLEKVATNTANEG